jgi:hypothetical protein
MRRKQDRTSSGRGAVRRGRPSRSVGRAGRTDDAVVGCRVGLAGAGSTWVHEAFRPRFDGRTGAAAARPDGHGALVAEVGPTTLNTRVMG